MTYVVPPNFTAPIEYCVINGSEARDRRAELVGAMREGTQVRYLDRDWFIVDYQTEVRPLRISGDGYWEW